MPTNYNLIINCWLSCLLSMKVMVFYLGSKMIISPQRFSLSYSEQFSRGEKNNNNRRLHTACNIPAGERIEELQLSIHNQTLPKKCCTVNNYHITSVRTPLVQVRQDPLLSVFLDGKKSFHMAQLCVQGRSQGRVSTLSPDISTNV